MKLHQGQQQSGNSQKPQPLSVNAMADKELIQIPRSELEEMRGEIRELRTAVDALVVAMKGNDMGTKGFHPRLVEVEDWISKARLRLAVIAGGLGVSTSAAFEAAKAWFVSGGHER